MPQVTFLASLQDYQADRVREIADRLRRDRPDVSVDVKDPEASRPQLAKLKLKFGPAVLVDGRLEFVGIPRYRMLVERVAKSAARSAAPASPPEPAGPKAEPPSSPR